MSLWIKRAVNELERLNSQLKMTVEDGVIEVVHSVYGYITTIGQDDKNPVGIVRELLMEASGEYHGKGT